MSGLDHAPGERYALDRLAELSSASPQWWSRSDGVGLRLRLREALELSESLATGGARTETVGWIFEDLIAEFNEKSWYISKHRATLAKRFGATVKPKPTALHPGSPGHATIKAALQQLERPDFREDLLKHLGDAARHAGWKESRLAQLDDLVVLYDAELQAEGFSPRWRAELAASARAHSDTGASLVKALDEAERTSRRTDPNKEFVVLAPVSAVVQPAGGTAGFPLMQRASADSLMNSWNASQVPTLMTDSEIVQASGFFEYYEKAPDRWAAAAQAADRFRAHLDQWRLRAGEVDEPKRALVYAAGEGASLEGLPPEPLDLAPSQLSSHPVQSGDLQACVAQIAQARGAATPTGAFVDLWTAIEALFGARGEAGIAAAEAMAGLCPLPYVDSVSRWVGDRLQKASYGTPPAGAEVDWLHTDVRADIDNARTALRDQLDPLGWLRLGTLNAWEPGSGFGDDVSRLRGRFERVGKRAYVIRNMRVHEARQSYPGQNGTLRMFADLVRLTLGHAIESAPLGAAYDQVLHAAMEIDLVDERWKSGSWDREEGLGRLS